MTMTLSGDGTITGLVAGGLPNATVTADDLASGAAVSNIGYTPTNQQAENINFRNRIINGDMRIDQRNAGAAVTSLGAFPLDRFLVGGSNDGAFSGQQDSSAPSGFINSLKVSITTADASLSGTQSLNVRQEIEGTNVADLGWGTANAKTVTLSFWVRSSLTGTFGGALRNSGVNRGYAFTYTISAADTWEYKTVTIAGDTSGTWLTTNGLGLSVCFGLGAGTDRSSTAGAWGASHVISATGAVSVIGTLNATWYITGVQLEVGSVATPFERRPYGTELALCERYYQLIASGDNRTVCMMSYYANTIVLGAVALRTAMRTTPTISTASGTDYYDIRGPVDDKLNSLTAYNPTPYQFGFINNSEASGTAGQCFYMQTSDNGAFIAASAEL